MFFKYIKSRKPSMVGLIKPMRQASDILEQQLSRALTELHGLAAGGNPRTFWR